MKATINYGLKKPEGTDVVNIEDLNYNADVIDQKIKEIDIKASDIKVPVTSVNGKTGAVTLAASDVGAVPTGRKINNKALSADIAVSATDIKTSSGNTVESELAQIKTDIGNETLQTTKKNLKSAINEVFQFANEGKKSIATAVTNKGVPSSPSDTFPTLANKIGQIETGYGVGDVIPGINLEVNLSEAWRFKGYNYSVTSVTVDSDGYVYSGSDDKTVRKISPTGQEIWKYTVPDRVKSVAVDSNGYVYFGSEDNAVRKLSPAGDYIWKFTGHTQRVTSVTVDSNGYVYSGSVDSTVRKISSTGQEVWKYTSNGWITSITLDPNRNVIACHDNKKIIKISPNGEEVWQYSPAGVPTAVVSDLFGDIWYGISPDSNATSTIVKISPEGKFILIVRHGDTKPIQSLAIDLNNNIYAGNDSGQCYKISSDGIVSWMLFPSDYNSPQFKTLAVDVAGKVYIGPNNNVVCINQSYLVKK